MLKNFNELFESKIKLLSDKEEKEFLNTAQDEQRLTKEELEILEKSKFFVKNSVYFAFFKKDNFLIDLRRKFKKTDNSYYYYEASGEKEEIKFIGKNYGLKSKYFKLEDFKPVLLQFLKDLDLL